MPDNDRQGTLRPVTRARGSSSWRRRGTQYRTNWRDAPLTRVSRLNLHNVMSGDEALNSSRKAWTSGFQFCGKHSWSPDAS